MSKVMRCIRSPAGYPHPPPVGSLADVTPCVPDRDDFFWVDSRPFDTDKGREVSRHICLTAEEVKMYFTEAKGEHENA